MKTYLKSVARWCAWSLVGAGIVTPTWKFFFPNDNKFTFWVWWGAFLACYFLVDGIERLTKKG